MTMNRKRLMRLAPRVIAIAAVMLVGGLMILVVKNFLANDKPEKMRVVHEISLIKPPPPPKIEEKPPEPVKKEEVKLPEPKPDEPPPEKAAQDEPPPGQNLGLDAAGQAGGDAFGLVGNNGGRGLIGGGGDEQRRFSWYAGVVQQHLYDSLERNKRLRESSYKVIVNVWVGNGGAIQRVEIGKSSGSNDLDSMIKAVLTQVNSISESPPENMPQPMKLRIVSRM